MKLLRNALIPNKKTEDLIKKDILFDDKIKEISSEISLHKAKEIYDVKENILLPGAIDAHVHFNDPGYNEHEDFISGTTASAFGGVTTIIDMPCTSIPPVTNRENLYKKLQVISKKAIIDFALWGGIRSNDFPFDYQKIKELWMEGIVGFKIYTISGMDTFKDLSYEQIRMVFQNSDKNMLFAFHAEDKAIIKNAMNQLSKEELKKAETYIKYRPIEAEYKAVDQILKLVENNKIHFVHISSKKAAQRIVEGKNSNAIDVTFETCPHYLEFTQKDLLKLKGRLKTAPVVKYEDDKNYLRYLLKNGKLDFVTTDHAGCIFEKEKLLDDFSKVYNGIPGTELFVMYITSEFYLKNQISIKRLVEMLSENQARRYGLYPQKGSLDIGTDADFVVINLSEKYRVDEKKLHSKGKYSPFVNREFSCKIDSTIVRGEFVYSKGKINVKPGYGKWIRRGNTFL